MEEESKNNDDTKKEYNELVRGMGHWIDYDFLQNLLEINFGYDSEIISHDVQSAVNVGDNYLSTLYKTSVEFKSKDSDDVIIKKFMIKGVPPSQTIVDMVEEMGVFKKEIFMYDNYLPTMNLVMKEYFPIDMQNVAPQCYKCLRRNTIVMEDLGEYDYKMVERRKQFDFEHTAVILETIAQFHALSIKVFEGNPELIEPLSKDIFVDREKLDSFFDGAFLEFSKAVGSWDGCSQFEPTLIGFADAFNKNIIKELLRPSEYLNVLNHGDLWVNNIMFKFNEDGSINHAKFIDFQVTRYTTPVPDLMYLLFTSVQVQVLIDKMDQLLQIYHTSLIKSFKYLNIDSTYTLDEFKSEFEDRLGYGIFSIVIIRTIVLAKKSVDISGEQKVETGEHPLAENFRNSLYKETTTEFLLYLESIGYMDLIRSSVEQFLMSEIESTDVESHRAPTAKARSSEEQTFIDRILTSIRKMIHEPMCAQIA